ncbi:MAG: dihydroorotase family protein [Candidatus Bathyarchaeia archaeon]
MSVDLVLKNGKIATSSGIFEGSIAIDEKKIVAIGKDALMPSANKVLDCSNKLILPGVIDTHVHVYIPGWIKETFKSGTRAAAVGGVTTILEMPSLDELLTTTVKAFEEKRRIGEKEAVVDFGLYGGEIQDQKDYEEISSIVERGAVGFKITMGGDTAAKNDGIIYESFKRISKSNSLAAVHAENNDLLSYFKELMLKSGRSDYAAYSDYRPRVVEEEAISRAIVFSKHAGNRLHIAHMSTKEGAILVKQAKMNGLRVTAETCPHYLLLSREDYEKYRHYIIINPPIRTKEDNENLWDGLAKGFVDNVATDHCAYYKTEKDKGLKSLWDTPPGISGLETMLTLLLSEGVNKGRISIETLVRITSENPAKNFGLYPRKGSLQVGSDADFVIVDLKKEHIIKKDLLESAGDFTPFEGWKLKGKPLITIVRGEIVAEEGEILAKEGYGKFVPSRR